MALYLTRTTSNVTKGRGRGGRGEGGGGEVHQPQMTHDQTNNKQEQHVVVECNEKCKTNVTSHSNWNITALGATYNDT
jgi:hypothetical protein